MAFPLTRSRFLLPLNLLLLNLLPLILLPLICVLPSCAQQFNPDLFADLHWRNIGPFRGGRTRAAAGVPGQPNVFYAGQVNGGVWKSDDYGRVWTPVFDAQPTQSIGAIAIAPSDPNVVYVASGEGLQRPDLSVGNGIYKSLDAGKTWEHLGLRDGQQIPALAVDPRNKNRVFAAVLGHPYGPNTERGIFRSTDGGENWEKVLYIDENTGASDVAIDPVNSNILYAGLWEGRQAPWEFGNAYNGTHGGLYKSTDGGTTWNKLFLGLPADAGQTYIAIAPSNPRRIYATIASGGTGGNQVQIYRSSDSGLNWEPATKDTRPVGRIGGGDLPMPKVDPKNPDILYSTSTVTWRSTDAGQTWTGIKGAPGGDDYQNIWINPDNPDIILLVSDQGAAVSVNGARTWSSWYNQPTAQLYHAIATMDFPYKVCGGQQESGSVCVSSRGNDGAITFRDWHPVAIIEYGYAAPDPLNPDIVYGAGRGQVSKYRWSTAQVQIISPTAARDPAFRADRTQPIIFSPVDPHVLFYAANVVFKTLDGGNSWQKISPDLTRASPGIPASIGGMAVKDAGALKQRGVVYSLAPSFRNVNTLWAGTDEGLIWITRDGGTHWKDITPPQLTAWSKVTQLEAGHFDDLTAYASVSRFRADDLHPQIYRTHDGGASWQPIITGLPDDAPIDTVREDPVRKGLLFAGSETSVWVSFDDGGHWQSLQLNLPHTSMRDLWIKDSDLIVATHGRSFWILDDITPLRQIAEKALAADAWLVKPSKAWRVRANTNTDTPLPPDEPFAENPPAGAVIDYYLKDKAEIVRLEIFRGLTKVAGEPVRAWSSDDEPEVKASNLKKLGIPTFWVERSRILSTAPGLHRWVWDMHYTAPESERHSYPIAAIPGRTPRLPRGPRALPGLYTVRLTVGEKTFTAPLTVSMDPRVKAGMPALQSHFSLQVKLATMMTGTTEAIRESRGVTEQIATLKKAAQGDLTTQLEALEKQAKASLTELTAANAAAAALYTDLDSADLAPTATQLAMVARLTPKVTLAAGTWEKIAEKEIAGMNTKLSAAGLATIVVESDEKGDDDEDGDDDDVG